MSMTIKAITQLSSIEQTCEAIEKTIIVDRFRLSSYILSNDYVDSQGQHVNNEYNYDNEYTYNGKEKLYLDLSYYDGKHWTSRKFDFSDFLKYLADQFLTIQSYQGNALTKPDADKYYLHRQLTSPIEDGANPQDIEDWFTVKSHKLIVTKGASFENQAEDESVDFDSRQKVTFSNNITTNGILNSGNPINTNELIATNANISNLLVDDLTQNANHDCDINGNMTVDTNLSCNAGLSVVGGDINAGNSIYAKADIIGNTIKVNDENKLANTGLTATAVNAGIITGTNVECKKLHATDEISLSASDHIWLKIDKDKLDAQELSVNCIGLNANDGAVETDEGTIYTNIGSIVTNNGAIKATGSNGYILIGTTDIAESDRHGKIILENGLIKYDARAAEGAGAININNLLVDGTTETTKLTLKADATHNATITCNSNNAAVISKLVVGTSTDDDNDDVVPLTAHGKTILNRLEVNKTTKLNGTLKVGSEEADDNPTAYFYGDAKFEEQIEDRKGFKVSDNIYMSASEICQNNGKPAILTAQAAYWS